MSGLGATLVFHPLHRCMGLTVSGCLGISWQLLCLLIGVLPVVMSHMMQWPNTSSARQLAVQLGAGNTTGSTTGSTAVLSGLLNGTGTAGVGVLAGAVGSNSSSNLQVLNSNFTVALAAVAGNTSTSTGDAAAAGAAAGAGGASALLHVLLAGLAASRFGLWLFDLVVSQLQQELVESHQLGESRPHRRVTKHGTTATASCNPALVRKNPGTLRHCALHCLSMASLLVTARVPVELEACCAS